MKEEALKLADELIKGELIDIYEKYTQQWKKDKVIEASTMIRRLVEELDRNKIYIQKMEDALGYDVSYYEQLNKPVNPFAWVDDCFSFFTDDDYSMLDDELKEGMIPLYTHPQTKPLSDDEINEIAMYCSDMNEYGHSKLDEFEFARAIEERHGIK